MPAFLESVIDQIRGNFTDEIGQTLAVVVVAIVVLFGARKAISRWSSRVEKTYVESEDHSDRERGQRLITLTSVLLMMLRISVWAVATLMLMGVWGIPMTPLVAVATTVGIAVGFGAQDLVRDIIGGFFILVEDQFGIGDVISIAGVSGTVQAIKLRTTVLRDLNGNVHHVPNGQIHVSSNMTPDFARIVADIPVSYDTDLDLAMRIILDEATALSEDPEWAGSFLEAPTMLGVNKLGDSAIEIRLLAPVITEHRWSVKREFNLRIKKRLDAEGIEIPFNYLNVLIQSDEK